MALYKYRMIEFWNKNAEQPISQEQIFLNDGGCFELSFEPDFIKINQPELFKSKYSIRETLTRFTETHRAVDSKHTPDHLLETLFS